MLFFESLADDMGQNLCRSRREAQGSYVKSHTGQTTLSVMEEPKDPLKKGITPIRSKATTGALESVGPATLGQALRSRTKARAEAKVLLTPGRSRFLHRSSP